MRLCVVGHSLLHPRQINFFRLLAEQESVDVTLLCPGEWRDLRAQPVDNSNFHIRTLRHIGGEDIYRYHLLNLEASIADGKFDVIYTHAEPASLVAAEVASHRARGVTDAALVIFTWENMQDNITPFARAVLSQYDAAVCGNDTAQEIVSKYVGRTVVLPQVGVDAVHFQARPVARHIGVAYIGRPVPEKGTEQLQLAWPMTRVLPWKPYLELPWWYSQCKLVVCFSQDTPYWKEQAMPYVAVEAMCCGAAAIVSNAGSIPFWLSGCPGAAVVPQGSVSGLRAKIEELLGSVELRERMAREGRTWVESNLSSKVVAGQLADFLRRSDKWTLQNA